MRVDKTVDELSETTLNNRLGRIKKNKEVDFATSGLDKEYTSDELEFLKAIDEYKRIKHRPYPTWIEVLNVLRALGWRKSV